MTSNPRAEHCIELTNYQELEEFVHAFAAGHINLLILIGAGGLQKSRTASAVLPSDTCWIQGNASPFGIYLKLFRYRDRFVVLDDVDALYKSKDGINLLKCLCQTEPVKTVSWQSATKQLDKEKVPREFETSSRVIIISNDWRSLNRNVAAVEDRGHVVRFSPSAEEVHRRAGEWFDDDEIYSWVGQQLHRVVNPSMRLYYRAQELKRSGLDWKKLTHLGTEDPKRRLVAELMRDTSFSTQEERATAFVRRGGGCRATYFNHLRRLRGQGARC